MFMTTIESVAFSGNNLIALYWASLWAFLQPRNSSPAYPKGEVKKMCLYLLDTATGDLF